MTDERVGVIGAAMNEGLDGQTTLNASGHQALSSLERELKVLRVFRARIEDAHVEHLRTGNYIKLGIAAQDAIRELGGAK